MNQKLYDSSKSSGKQSKEVELLLLANLGFAIFAFSVFFDKCFKSQERTLSFSL